MIENVLVRKNLSLKVKITVKSLISAGIIALADGVDLSGYSVADFRINLFITY